MLARIHRVGHDVARGIDAHLRQTGRLGCGVMLNQPQDVPAPGHPGFRLFRTAEADGIVDEQLGARCQIIRVFGERGLERLSLHLAEAVALQHDALIPWGPAFLSQGPFDRQRGERNRKHDPFHHVHGVPSRSIRRVLGTGVFEEAARSRRRGSHRVRQT